jgi:hypothetical protein
MKDCFMGLCSGDGWFTGGCWLTNCSAIVSSSTSNSSFSSSTLSLGFCRMVRSISWSIGRMVGFLDRSPCMKRTKFCSYCSFNTTVRMVSGTMLDHNVLYRSQPGLDCNHRNYTAAKLEEKKKKTKNKNIFLKNKNKNKTKQD